MNIAGMKGIRSHPDNSVPPPEAKVMADLMKLAPLTCRTLPFINEFKTLDSNILPGKSYFGFF
ncbi:hypothetical protein AZH53_01900 [Methanomicrobiaceae archaeon CYW5]|nr:hypothetical protein [Methanovulcanius yangii]